MRKAILSAVSVLLLAFPLCYGSPQQDSVAEAARKAREQKKNQPKSAKVFTNDNILAEPGRVNVVGSAPPPAETEAKAAAPGAANGKAPAAEEKATQPEETKGEAYWRKRFTEARGKLRTAEKELDILQREYNLQQQQYYSDPNKALRQQLDRSDLNNQFKAINDKKQEVAQLKQALSDLEGELRRAGGDPGWARE